MRSSELHLQEQTVHYACLLYCVCALAYLIVQGVVRKEMTKSGLICWEWVICLVLKLWKGKDACCRCILLGKESAGRGTQGSLRREKRGSWVKGHNLSRSQTNKAFLAFLVCKNTWLSRTVHCLIQSPKHVQILSQLELKWRMELYRNIWLNSCQGYISPQNKIKRKTVCCRFHQKFSACIQL